MRLGDLLKNARKKSGLTLREVADATGTSFSRLSELETGARISITVRSAARLAPALGLSVSQITNACVESLRAAGEI